MGWLDRLKAFAGKPQVDPSNTEFIYIYLPEPLEPDERFAKYEVPLDVELRVAALGFVSGGGSCLSDMDDTGFRQIEWCGVDVDAVDIDTVRSMLRLHLPDLGCLPGTELQFRINGEPLLDHFDGSDWQIGTLT